MLDTPGIATFDLMRWKPGPKDRSWCARYRMRDQAALDTSLRDHAPRMRGEGIARFGDAFRAGRRTLTPLDS